MQLNITQKHLPPNYVHNHSSNSVTSTLDIIITSDGDDAKDTTTDDGNAQTEVLDIVSIEDEISYYKAGGARTF